MSSAIQFASTSFHATITILKPYFASWYAYDLPIPFVAPVITAHPPLYLLNKFFEGQSVNLYTDESHENTYLATAYMPKNANGYTHSGILTHS